MVIVSRMALPVSVPARAPRPVIDVPVTLMVTVPDTLLPDCVTCIVIEPGPDESVAVPLHEPAMFSELDGAEDGAEGDDEPPRHAAADTNAASPSAVGHPV